MGDQQNEIDEEDESELCWGRVEDFLGKGIEDLRALFIRTPLPPSVTLLEDPLRGLRAIRFAAYLHPHPPLETLPRNPEALSEFLRYPSPFLDLGLQLTLLCPLLHTALSEKVSRERKLIEFWKMISLPLPNASHAIGLLWQFRLDGIVFWEGGENIHEENRLLVSPLSRFSNC